MFHMFGMPISKSKHNKNRAATVVHGKCLIRDSGQWWRHLPRVHQRLQETYHLLLGRPFSISLVAFSLIWVSLKQTQWGGSWKKVGNIWPAAKTSWQWFIEREWFANYVQIASHLAWRIPSAHLVGRYPCGMEFLHADMSSSPTTGTVWWIRALPTYNRCVN